jgi:trimethylamine:corrinoid methyltransferase-like protein
VGRLCRQLRTTRELRHCTVPNKLCVTLARMVKTATAKSGKRGKRGKRGRRGERGITPDALRQLIHDLAATRKDASIQLMRIAQLQAQLDETLKALKEMGQKAEQQQRARKKR